MLKKSYSHALYTCNHSPPISNINNFSFFEKVVFMLAWKNYAPAREIRVKYRRESENWLENEVKLRLIYVQCIYWGERTRGGEQRTLIRKLVSRYQHMTMSMSFQFKKKTPFLAPWKFRLRRKNKTQTWKYLLTRFQIAEYNWRLHWFMHFLYDFKEQKQNKTAIYDNAETCCCRSSLARLAQKKSFEHSTNTEIEH